jgi:hypothetical protein
LIADDLASAQPQFERRFSVCSHIFATVALEASRSPRTPAAPSWPIACSALQHTPDSRSPTKPTNKPFNPQTHPSCPNALPQPNPQPTNPLDPHPTNPPPPYAPSSQPPQNPDPPGRPAADDVHHRVGRALSIQGAGCRSRRQSVVRQRGPALKNRYLFEITSRRRWGTSQHIRGKSRRESKVPAWHWWWRNCAGRMSWCLGGVGPSPCMSSCLNPSRLAQLSMQPAWIWTNTQHSRPQACKWH